MVGFRAWMINPNPTINNGETRKPSYKKGVAKDFQGNTSKRNMENIAHLAIAKETSENKLMWSTDAMHVSTYFWCSKLFQVTVNVILSDLDVRFKRLDQESFSKRVKPQECLQPTWRLLAQIRLNFLFLCTLLILLRSEGIFFRQLRLTLSPLNIWWWCRPHCQQKLKHSNTPHEKNNWTHHIMLNGTWGYSLAKNEFFRTRQRTGRQNINLSQYSETNPQLIIFFYIWFQEAISRHLPRGFWQIHHKSSLPPVGPTQVHPHPPSPQRPVVHVPGFFPVKQLVPNQGHGMQFLVHLPGPPSYASLDLGEELVDWATFGEFGTVLEILKSTHLGEVFKLLWDIHPRNLT